MHMPSVLVRNNTSTIILPCRKTTRRKKPVRNPNTRPVQRPPPPPPPSPMPGPSPLFSPAQSPVPQRQPLILREDGVVKATGKPRCSEVAGGTAAGCAAVCCCCPCGILSFLVFTMVKLPAGLLRNAVRKRRMCKKKQVDGRRDINDGSLVDRVGDDHGDFDGGGKGATVAVGGPGWPDRGLSEEMTNMEKEMWERFEGTGFWRSPSQRDV